MINFQALFDGMSAQWQKERAATQLTLGELIDILKAMPPDLEVAGLCEPHSYRGYYDDLAFHLGPDKRKAIDLLQDCKEAIGKVFDGYKGGEFVMGALTPLWVANYGYCGVRLMSMEPDGSVKLASEDEE